MDNQTTGSSKDENEELKDIETHMAGATDLHLTRHTDQTVQIDPPVVKNPGRYDTRTGKYSRED